ncbi:MAG: hypothetical protein IPM79_04525 [Polyangiaceae bacterium]|nr:hypothetical protein [Polyangiaceae bacterium]MBK8936914.1 hypothetical protein [Polyangiaceae bacterium]
MADDAPDPITLKEVQLRLGVAQHVLIHLCERGVIVPDFADASGRGKRREFSQRNLFEFALALTLRSFEVSVATTALLVRLVRSFERAVAKAVPGFEFLAFLATKGAALGLHLYDGTQLVFAARGGGLAKPVLLAVDLTDVARGPASRPRLDRLDELPRAFDGHLELDLVRIARRLTE